MKKTILKYFFTLFTLIIGLNATGSVIDSIGSRVENGKIVIIHKVETKETAYSISKRYGVSLDVLYSSNATAKSDLKVGQLLKIVTDRNADGSLNKVEPTIVSASSDKSNRFHTVQKGETLYSISKQYGYSVDLIKEWNGLESNELSNGQMLVVKKEGVQPVEPSKPKVYTKPNDGKKYHQVQKGETLYALSKKYNLEVNDIKKWNNLNSNELELGRYLRVEGARSVVKTITNPKTTNTAMSNGNEEFHIVQKGETLYSISKLYGVSTNDLKRWNSLSSEELVVRQMLAVSGSTASAVSSSDALNAVNKNEKNDYYSKTSNPKTDGDHHSVNEALAESLKSLEQHKEVKQQYEESAKQGKTKVISNTWNIPSNITTYGDSIKYGVKGIKHNIGKYKKTYETGVCELIEKQLWDTKYNALHAEVPLGTIIQVRNPKNDVSVFVKVVGRLNEDAKHPHRILKISHHAVEHLAPEYSRFPVEISYLPAKKIEQ